MICILQNDSDFYKEISPVEKALDNTGYEYSTWRTFLDGFPEDELSCDGLIITGGFSMSNYFEGRALSSGGNFVRSFRGPILGICLGMQILARIGGESLVVSKELGVTKIRLDALHELFRELKVKLAPIRDTIMVCLTYLMATGRLHGGMKLSFREYLLQMG